MTWGQIPALCAVLGVVGLVLVCWPTAVDRLSTRWAERQAHANRPRGLPRPAQYRWRDDDPTVVRGRHRPELAGPDAVSATGIMRALNADADQLPAISRRAVRR